MVPVSYSVRNLMVRRTTTAATALGIGLVVFVFASVLMLGAGLQRAMGRSGSADVARCPAVARRDVDRRYRTLSRLQDRVSAAIDRGEDDSALGASADEALDALCAAAADAAEACPAATGLAPLAPILRARDTAALGRYRVTP
jgi:hypothetical protein